MHSNNYKNLMYQFILYGKRPTGKSQYFYNNESHFRLISSSTTYYFPLDNDQDRLIEEIQEVERDFNDLDGEIEDFKEELRISEENLMDDSDSDSEETELSREVQTSTEEKDEVVGDNMVSRDEALFGHNNIRDDKSLLLDLVIRQSGKDVDDLNNILEQVSDEDKAYEIASGLLQKAESLKEKAERLDHRWHENDLPSLSEPAGGESFPQDSSDIVRSDFDSSDYYEE